MTELLVSIYPWTKAGHILSVIAWMAGLFYLPRLFVYHAERGEEHEKLKTTFQTMERKLFQVIMKPAMIATWIFGLLLVLTPGIIDWSSVWPWTKAISVIAMTGFHEWCGAEVRRNSKGPVMRTGRTYRIMNEVPTLLLFIIVISVVVRPF